MKEAEYKISKNTETSCVNNVVKFCASIRINQREMKEWPWLSLERFYSTGRIAGTRTLHGGSEGTVYSYDPDKFWNGGFCS